MLAAKNWCSNTVSPHLQKLHSCKTLQPARATATTYADHLRQAHSCQVLGESCSCRDNLRLEATWPKPWAKSCAAPLETPACLPACPPLVSAAGCVSIYTEQFWRLPDRKHPNCSCAPALFSLVIASSRPSSLLAFFTAAPSTLLRYRIPSTSDHPKHWEYKLGIRGTAVQPWLGRWVGSTPSCGGRNTSCHCWESQDVTIPARVCKTGLLSADSEDGSVPESSPDRILSCCVPGRREEEEGRKAASAGREGETLKLPKTSA